MSSVQSGYVLGYSDAEQDRLIRQAMLLAPMTERLFREAGIGAGQRVLDIGSGLGDVPMIAARLVGASGEVVGIERDAGSLARARERVSAVGFRNVRFIQADVNDIAIDGSFDAAVGRLVLNHFADPVAALRSVSRLVVPGAVVAFQEGSWSPTRGGDRTGEHDLQRRWVRWSVLDGQVLGFDWQHDRRVSRADEFLAERRRVLSGASAAAGIRRSAVRDRYLPFTRRVNFARSRLIIAAACLYVRRRIA